MRSSTTLHQAKSPVAHAVAITVAIAALHSQFAHAQTAPAPRPAASAEADDGTPRAKEDVIRLGTITVTGQGDKLGAGLIINEDTVKARSTITRASTEKDRATGNVYNSIELLPSVNAFNHDATGLFGGGMSMRGFNSDQIGFTINGVPVNDSGSFSVFPQQYADQENVCTNSVAQGSSDQETPHIGASGGSIGVTTCDPLDKSRFRFGQTIGGLNLSRTYLRYDTGLMLNNKFKTFLSYSRTEADKWKGDGGAIRDHIDVGFNWDIAPGHRVLGSILYNKAINNNINNPTLNELITNGYKWDYASNFIKTTAVAGTAQTETGSSPAYYKLSVNPFENAIASVSGLFTLSNNLSLRVQPYFWYGFGTGGIQQNNLSESTFLTPAGTLTGTKDLNGDGDTRDRFIVARSNVTNTLRPGVTSELNWQLGEHSVRAGIWYERARHSQTAPAVPVDANGEPGTIWLDTNQITRSDGSLFQNRNWTTLTEARAIFFTDNWTLMNDRMLISAGIRFPSITRKFENKASEGGVVGYKFDRTYSDTLPQIGIRYNLDKRQQVFGNIAKNFRAPPNFAYAPTNGSIRIVAGQVEVLSEITPETSTNIDLGYRYQGDVTLSATFFNVDYKNRQGNAFDPLTNTSVYTNLGNVRNRGLELEMGTKPYKGFTLYASATTQHSKIAEDLRVSSTVSLPLAGKEFTNTPRHLFAMSVQYTDGPMYVRFKAKETGTQFASLVNDEEAPAYTKAELDGGYSFGKQAFADNVQLRWNVSNLFNKQYRSSSSGAVTNGTRVGTFNAQAIRYYLGAPRYFSMSLSADF